VPLRDYQLPAERYVSLMLV